MRLLIDVLFLPDKSCLWQRVDAFDWLHFSLTSAVCGSPPQVVLEISAAIDCQITELALTELAEYLIFNSQWGTGSSESKDDSTKWTKRTKKIHQYKLFVCWCEGIQQCFASLNTLQKTFHSRLFVSLISPPESAVLLGWMTSPRSHYYSVAPSSGPELHTSN